MYGMHLKHFSLNDFCTTRLSACAPRLTGLEPPSLPPNVCVRTCIHTLYTQIMYEWLLAAAHDLPRTPAVLYAPSSYTCDLVPAKKYLVNHGAPKQFFLGQLDHLFHILPFPLGGAYQVTPLPPKTPLLNTIPGITYLSTLTPK